MKWKFKENSILNNYNERTPCKEIFQAVCDEIGDYYKSKGWKYAKSRPKITFQNSEIKIVITFWSSGSNIPGEYVNLEMIPSIYSLELKRKNISKTGYILGFVEMLTENYEEKPLGTKLIINAFNERKEIINEHDLIPEIKYNNSVNIYGITAEKFSTLIEFINDKIVVWKENIFDAEKIYSFLNKLTENDRKNLKNSDFGKYGSMKFEN